MHEKKGNGKSKKDTRKWCDFHNNPWHNTDECHSIPSLMAKLKDKESNPDLDHDSKIIKGDRSIMQNPLILSQLQ